jgi:hypothetical protein
MAFSTVFLYMFLYNGKFMLNMYNTETTVRTVFDSTVESKQVDWQQKGYKYSMKQTPS